MEYTLECWMKVIEKIGYTFLNESSRYSSDINIISYKKDLTFSYKIIYIYFNYLTSEVTSTFVREHYNFPNIDDKITTMSEFIKENLENFREVRIEEILSQPINCEIQI